MSSRQYLGIAACLALLLVCMPDFGLAEEEKAATPEAAAESWRFHDIVPVEFVQQHVRFPKPADVMIIDARPKRPKFDRGHIPGAISIPDRQFEDMTNLLPADKNTLLIYYCGGLKCKLSHKSAKKAEKLGYTNVKVFAEGFPKWMRVAGNYPSVTVDWVNSQLKKTDPITLVDARPTRSKYDKGHIPTALSIPDRKFEEKQNELPADKDALLVYYCGGFKCKLSHQSAAKAIALGYTNVKVIAKGFPAWKKAGFPVGTALAEAAPAAPAIKAGEEEGSIDHNTFVKIVSEKPESIFLVDVRDLDEYKETGSLKTAVHMSVDDVEKNMATLPTDKPIVFICGTGARSGESYYMVKDMRPEIKAVYYLEAEMTFNKDGSFKINKSS